MSDSILSDNNVTMETTSAEMANIKESDHEGSKFDTNDLAQELPNDDFDILDGRCLYRVISEAKASFTDIVDSWIENYASDDSKAIISLMQLVLAASNNRLIVTPEMFEKRSFPEIYDEIMKHFINEEAYPLISEEGSTFSPCFREFVFKLSKASRFSFINNDQMMNSILSFLKIASSSAFRPLRHTATYFALIFSTGLLYNISSIAENFHKLSQDSKDNTEILSTSFSQKDRADEKNMRNHFQFLFKEIFASRYRDVSPEIRTLCIYELGCWMLIYPREILKDSKLKYIGWSLHDKIAAVRLQCLKALQPLLTKEISINLLENFLNKFKERIVNMVNDVNDDVCCEALQALLNIQRFRADFLAEADLTKIVHLTRSTNRKISSQAVLLILEFFQIKVKKDPSIEECVGFLKTVSHCIGETQDLQSILLVIDSFSKYSSYLTNWSMYIHYLLDYEDVENGSDYLFLCLFYASILYFIGCKFPLERMPRKNITAEITKFAPEEKAKFTASIMNSYKNLFNKYSGEKEKALILVGFVEYFDVSILLKNVENQKFIEEVAILMQNLIMKSFEKEFLLLCIKSLYFLCSNHADHTDSDELKQKLISKIVNNLLNILQKSMNLYLKKKQGEAFETMVQITGILSLFMTYFDIQNSDINDNIDVLVSSIDTGVEENREIVENIFLCKTSFLISKCATFSNDKLKQQNSSQRNSFVNELLDEVLMIMEYSLQLFNAKPTCTDNIVKRLCLLICKVSGKETAQDIFSNAGFQNNLIRVNEAILAYLKQHVFSYKPNNSKEDNSKQEVVMCYCTLIMKQIVPVDNFKHILRYFSSHVYLQEVIKHVLMELKSFNMKKVCTVISDTFQLCFEECLPANPSADFSKYSANFLRSKELSKKIVLQFGINAMQRKNALLLIQKLVIDAFLARANFTSLNQDHYTYILEIIQPFHTRTSESDQKNLLVYMSEKIGLDFERVAKSWPSVGTYLGVTQAQQPSKAGEAEHGDPDVSSLGKRSAAGVEE